MNPIGLSQRLVAVLLLAVAPPLLLLAALKTPAEPVGGLGATITLAIVFLLSALWIVVVAVGSSWAFGHDVRSLIRLAERGRAASDGMEEDGQHLSDAHRRVAGLLDERDRQVRELATQVAAAPITQDARTVAQHVAEAARRVTGDATWSLAVLHAPDPSLPHGVYPYIPAEEPGAIEELHRWASVAGEGDQRRARRIEGPWGAFVVADVGEALGLHAVLMAPWEGRMDPTPSELTLVNLLAQHAETAIEHALLYARVRAQADELNRLAALQTDFLRGVTHDLQTPLTAIGALAADLRGETGLSADAGDSLRVISFQADRLRRMVGQLLTMSGLEAGAIKPRSEVFRAEPLVRRVWQALHADGRELELAISGPDRLMVADPDRLEQALWALLDNAVKYSPDGQAIRVALECRATGDDDPSSPSGLVEVISISDRGIGMDVETLGRASGQFYRSDEARRLVPDGSGIGLYTAVGLVRLMGGHLGIESAPGLGTTISIALAAELAGEPESAVTVATTA